MLLNKPCDERCREKNLSYKLSIYCMVEMRGEEDTEGVMAS